MGYPMSYRRVVGRNSLRGGYSHSEEPNPDLGRQMLAGDMRRLERDTRDEAHLEHYAEVSGATTEQVKAVFDEFFDGHTCGYVGPPEKLRPTY